MMLIMLMVVVVAVLTPSSSSSFLSMPASYSITYAAAALIVPVAEEPEPQTIEEEEELDLLPPPPPPSSSFNLVGAMRATTRPASSSSSSSASSYRLYDASEDCPCLDANSEGMRAWRSAMIQKNASCYVRPGDDDDANFFCYPPDYGSGKCNFWDFGLAECASRTSAGVLRRLEEEDPTTTTTMVSEGLKTPRSLQIPFYCQAAWCWVNTSNCASTRRFKSAHVEPAKSLKLNVSYETCGNTDSYTPRLLDQLRGKRLRVAFPADSSATWPLLTLSDGKTKAGAAPDLLRYAADEYGLELVEVPLRNRSLDKFKSTYTACTHAVAIGDADVCGAAAWVTLQRRSLANFGEIFETDPMFLVSRSVSNKKKALSASEVLLRPFLPFTPAMWGIIVAACFVTSIAFWIIESDAKFKLRTITRHMYFGFLSYFAGVGPMTEPTTPPGRLLQLSWGFFLLVLMSTYTAKLAAFFAVPNDEHQIRSLEEAQRRGLSICVPSALFGAITSARPEIRKLAVEVDDNAMGLLDAMDAGICGVAIFYPEGVLTEQVRNNSHCDKSTVGDVIYTVGRGFPINNDLAFPFTALTNDYQVQGVWQYFKESNIRRYRPAPSCPDIIDERDVGDDDAAVPLGVDELGGNAAILLIGISVSLCVYFFWRTTEGFRTMTTFERSLTILTPKSRDHNNFM